MFLLERDGYSLLCKKHLLDGKITCWILLVCLCECLLHISSSSSWFLNFLLAFFFLPRIFLFKFMDFYRFSTLNHKNIIIIFCRLLVITVLWKVGSCLLVGNKYQRCSYRRRHFEFYFLLFAYKITIIIFLMGNFDDLFIWLW